MTIKHNSYSDSMMYGMVFLYYLKNKNNTFKYNFILLMPCVRDKIQIIFGNKIAI